MITHSSATPENSAIVDASDWLTALVTGSLATGVAVMAIAFVGFAMMGRRINVRRGLSAVLGCFLLFGAPVIAQGLSDLARSDSAASPSQPYSAQGTPPPLPDALQQDPYAGASLLN